MIYYMHVGPDIAQAKMMVDSADYYWMETCQLTDMDSPTVNGDYLRTPRYDGEGLMLFRTRIYAAVNKPGIYMDTDMLIKHDLSPLMELDFDIMVTKRSHVIKDPNGVNISNVMPYNGGFVVVKDETFWPEVYDRMLKMSDKSQEWYGDQIAIQEAVKTRKTIELPVKIYNRTVKKAGLDVSDAWVLHFKGDGKEVMQSYV
jgi:hypothetical protein